jgi:hypothetical protein
MAEIKEAYADGAEVQIKPLTLCWIELDEPDFDGSVDHYRIKPKPVFRYWSRPKDVPVGRAVMRKKEQTHTSLIYYADSAVIRYGCDACCYDRLSICEHAMLLPDGTLGPWLPCGKEEV